MLFFTGICRPMFFTIRLFIISTRMEDNMIPTTPMHLYKACQ